jgi:hypothetical protein
MMARSKKINTTEESPVRAKKGIKLLDCSECFYSVRVALDTKSVVCSACVARQVAPPEVKKPLEEKRPKGWHFKAEYISPSGKIYHKGREVNELPTSDPEQSDSIEANPVVKRKRGRPKGSKNKPK